MDTTEQTVGEPEDRSIETIQDQEGWKKKLREPYEPVGWYRTVNIHIFEMS